MYVCTKVKRMLFFSKKNYIADMLEGLVDMHCHVLPNIDDGAKDSEMSLEMLNQYREIGYTGLIATPHIMEGFYDNTAKGIKETFEDFKLLTKKNGFEGFSVSAAAEYMMDSGFDDLIETNEFLPIRGNKVLVEMSYLRPSFRSFDQIFNLQQRGFIPVLAHPERYSYLSDISEVIDYKTKGCQLQLNLLSLGGHYGNHAFRQSLKLLEKGHFEFMGTDAHHPGHFNVLKRITIPRKYVAPFEALVIKTKENLRS